MTRVTTNSKETRKSTALSEKEKQQRKQQVLTQGRSSITRSIADAVVIKAENIFFLSRPDGSVPLGDSHGYGLYYHDCRFLNGYELTLADTKMNSLVSSITAGNSAIFEFTNPELMVREGEHIPSEQIGLTWERTLDGDSTRCRRSSASRTLAIKSCLNAPVIRSVPDNCVRKPGYYLRDSIRIFG